MESVLVLVEYLFARIDDFQALGRLRPGEAEHLKDVLVAHLPEGTQGVCPACDAQWMCPPAREVAATLER